MPSPHGRKCPETGQLSSVYRVVFPPPRDTNVLHGDINALLKHAIERHEEATKTGKKEAMEANQLPPKGAINFIYCGPPCQGFTGMNRFPKADDVLNSLIATTLSCVDFYRPTYFLLGASMDLLGRLIRGRGIGILIYDSVLSSRFTCT